MLATINARGERWAGRRCPANAASSTGSPTRRRCRAAALVDLERRPRDASRARSPRGVRVLVWPAGADTAGERRPRHVGGRGALGPAAAPGPRRASLGRPAAARRPGASRRAPRRLAAWARGQRRRGARRRARRGLRAPVGGDDLVERPRRAQVAVVEPRRLGADPRERGMVVAGGDRRSRRGRGCSAAYSSTMPRNSWSSASKTSSSSSTSGEIAWITGEPEPRPHPQRVGVDGPVEGVVELHPLGDQVHVCGASPRARAPASTPSSSAFSRPVRSDDEPARRWRAASRCGRARSTSPSSGGRTEATTRSSVVLPDPVGPTRARPDPGLDVEVDAAQPPGGRADAAKQPEPRRHHAAEAVEVEAHADAVEPCLAAGQRRCPRFGDRAHRGHPSSFASAPARARRSGTLTARISAAAAERREQLPRGGRVAVEQRRRG